MADYLAFSTIYGDVCRAMGDLQATRSTEVKAVINQVYLNEILNVDEMRPLFWLRKRCDSVFTKAADTVTGISLATSPATMTATNKNMVTNDIVSLYGMTGATELNNRLFRLKRTSDSYELYDLDNVAVDSPATAYVSGGIIVHRGVASSLSIRQIIGQPNFHGYNDGLEEITDKELEASTSWWDENTTRPTRFLHYKSYTNAGTENDCILWFPGADAAYQMRFWYEVRPSRLSSDSDVPLLPAQFHDAIVAGAITRLGENKTQVEAGVVWPGLYKAQLQAIKEYNRKLWKPYEDKRSGIYLI